MVLPSQISWQTRRQVGYSITAWEINRAYYFDGFPVVIEGVQRMWESSFQSKAFLFQRISIWRREYKEVED